MAAKRATKPAKPVNVVAQARGSKPAGTPSRGQWLWENAKSLAGAILIYLFVKTFFVEAFRIPTGSMVPTLLVGDWLFVNKLVYGPALPFSNVHLPGYSAPKRNDIVVFVSPYQADNAPDFTPTLVKRLVGEPGDTLYMREGLLYRNGVAQPQSEAMRGNPKKDPSETSPLYVWQHTIEVKNSRFGPPPGEPTHDNWGPLLIPANHYFMMGDNRYCSKDSRYWGIVPRENVRGRPIFVYYSYRPATTDECNGEGSDRPLSFITDIRWGRIGHVIK